MRAPFEISRQLRSRRQQLGLSLSEVARRADTSPATLSRYERGWERFEVSTLRKLATALSCRLVVKLEPVSSEPLEAAPAQVARRLRRLFWDVRLTERHLKDNTLWVVERVLEYGQLRDVRSLIGLLGRDEFLRQVCKARFSSPRTRTFWRRMLDKEGVTCTRRFSREEAATFWPGSSP